MSILSERASAGKVTRRQLLASAVQVAAVTALAGAASVSAAPEVMGQRRAAELKLRLRISTRTPPEVRVSRLDHFFEHVHLEPHSEISQSLAASLAHRDGTPCALVVHRPHASCHDLVRFLAIAAEMASGGLYTDQPDPHPVARLRQRWEHQQRYGHAFAREFLA